MRSSVDACSVCSDLREINEARVQGILSYLDEVESYSPCVGPQPQPSSLAVIQSQPQPPRESAAAVNRSSPFPSCCSVSSLVGAPRTMDANVYHGIRAKIDNLKGECDSKQRINEELQKKLDTARAHEAQRVARTQEIAKEQIETLKRENAAALQKHLKCIQELLTDKESLTHRTNALSQQNEQLKASLEQEVKKVEAAHAQALSEIKGKLLTQEKARREEWAAKESKKIKDNTLKAIEPDIALLMNRHKAEKRRMEEEHSEIVKRKDEALLEKEKQITEARLKALKESEEMVGKERDAFRQKLNEECERHQRLLEDERRSFAAKKDATESFFADQRAMMQKEIQSLNQQLQESRMRQDDLVRQQRLSSNDELAKIRKEHNDEIAKLKEQHASERGQWEAQYVASIAERLRQKEAELRANAERERDEAIRVVIAKLEEEQMAQLKLQRENDRVRKEGDARLQRDHERMKIELSLCSEQLQTALSVVKDKDQQIAAANERIKVLQQRMGNCSEEAQAEFTQRLQTLDQSWHHKLQSVEAESCSVVAGLQKQLEAYNRDAETKAQDFASQLRQAEQKHAAELSQINDRVLIAVSKKDQQIRILTESIAALQATLADREAELERHRALLAD